MPDGNEIISILEEELSIGDLDPDASIDSYGFNSIFFVEFVVLIEERFAVSLDMTGFENVNSDTTISELASVFSREIENAQAGSQHH